MWLSFNGWKRGLLPPSIFYKSVLWNFGTFVNMKINKLYLGGWSHNGGGIGWGDHFLPPKFIKISFECWATSTKQLLNAGGGHQAPRKAAICLQKEVEQNITDKKKDKTVRDGDLSWEGNLKEKFPNTRKPSAGLWGILKSQRAT